MKKLELSILFFIIIASSIAATYTGTKPSDLNLTTPTEGNTKVSEFNNSDREIKTVIVNLENITTVTGTYTVAGTQTGILGSSTTAFTISFPAASTLATGTITKRYMIKNINNGTITLNLTVDGIGSPTVAGSQTFKLFTNGTSWFEDRVGRAAVASNADLLDDLDSTYFTNATNISTGTVALARIPGTLTGKSADLLDEQTGSYYTNASNLDSGTIPLARIPTTLTGKDADTIDTINGASIVQTSRTIDTTAPLAGGGDLSANLTLSMPLATSGQNGYISSADWATFNNKLSASRTITTTSPLTIAGAASADLTADRTIAMATATSSQDGFMKKEDFQAFSNRAIIVAGSGITSSSSTGTTTITNNGVLQIVAGTGITVTGNGTGTPTITAVGTITSGGWLDTGTATEATAGYPIIAHGTVTLDAAYGMTGLTDAWIPNTITLDDLTQITTRNYSALTGTSTISPTTATITTAVITNLTATTSTATTAVITNLTATNGTVTNLYGVGFGNIDKFIGVDKLLLPGTTTALTGTGSTQRLYSLVRTNQAGTATPTSIADSSGGTRTVTINGNVTTTTAGSKFAGGMSFNAGASSCSLADAAVWTPAGDFFCRFWWSPLNTTNAAGLTGHYSTDGGFRVMFNPSDNTGIQLYIQANGGGTIVNISEGSDTNWATGTARFVEVSRSGNDYFLFVGGTIVGSTTTATAWFNPTNAFHVGGDGDWGDPSANGTMDDFIWNDGAAGHTSNYTPPTVPEGDSLPAGTDLYLKFDDTSAFANYTYYTFQIIPPGTTAAFLNIVDDGTQSSKVEMVLGSTTPYSSATVHVLQGITASRTLFGFYDAYCFEASKDIIGSGTAVQDEAYAIAKKVNIVKSHPVDPKMRVTQEEAEFNARQDYMDLFKKSDIETYKTDHITEYAINVAGSITANWVKLNSDAYAYHENQRKVEFEVLPDRNERIRIKKKTMESNKNITSISIVADDPSTDDLLKGADKRTASTGNQIGVLFGAFQKQTEEIGSLTAALENQKVAYNEEVDNLYKLINAIIVALLAVGGVSGWSTIRRKRKGT